MENAINVFLTERKAAWLKQKISDRLDESKKLELQQEAEVKYSPANWIPDAANRASQLSMVSHPGKFSHPSARISNIIAQTENSSDGYLRSGNVEYELDVFGNAAALDVYKFLCLTLSDGKSILMHLEENSDLIKNCLNFPNVSYDEIRKKILSIKTKESQKLITDRLLKQVYFPVNDGYNLLSLLTPSGIISGIKSKIDEMKYSEISKSSREAFKKEKFSEGFDDIYGLTVLGYGGTQPQNISVLNSKNAGRSYLLSSIPPHTEKRNIRLPHSNFFENSLRLFQFKELFLELHKQMKNRRNNVEIRNEIKDTLQEVVAQILMSAEQIRRYAVGWSEGEHYQNLSDSQSIWLDDDFAEVRDKNEEWREEIINEMARWIFHAYETINKNDKFMLSTAELAHIKAQIMEVVQENNEVLA